MVNTESVDQAKYRVRMARQGLRHSKVNVDQDRAELRQAKLVLKDAKIQVREHKRRGHAVRAHERSGRKGFFESEAKFRDRQRIESIEEAPLR